MQVSSPGRERSAVSHARRRQIIEATIAVIAAEGFAQASFARIARQAGLSSTRHISYHFAGKGELVSAVVGHVVTAMGAAVGDQVRAEATAAARLRTYIQATVAFADQQRAQVSALLQIVQAGALPRETGVDDPVPAHLVAILRQGQHAGEFRDFDPTVVAMAVQRSIEAVLTALRADPDLDCAAFGRQLATLFDLGTAKRS